mmetsp:Transcript_21516/g.43797  ORF Transcript_21516/g.43797 Transcript_21516/m.43797 type:complete len:104 (+) Transcript_21516:43-354(+)
MGNSGSSEILTDSQVAGGTQRRQLDHYLSHKFDGKLSENFNPENPSFYAKWGEPTLHAAEHTWRAASTRNGAELARAMDEMKTIGKGLHTNEGLYQGKQVKKV